MKVATWNVNSVRTRLEQLLGWLSTHQPDVLCLQELKCTDEQFPALELSGLGYHATVFGQRSYNGVAILSKEKPEQVVRNMADGDEQARLVAARVSGVHVVGLYAPNGQEVDSEAYRYKLEWYRRLTRFLPTRFAPTERAVVCGDFNVAPTDLDVWDPRLFHGQTLFTAPERAAFEELKVACGLVDAVRLKRAEAGLFSWWDYRMSGFKKNRGLRIDHLLVTAPVAQSLQDAGVDKQAREGKQPSDHAPVWIEFG